MSLLKKSLIAPSLAILLATNLYSANYTVDTTNATKAIEKISELSNIPFIVDTNILNGKNTNKIQNVQNLDEALKQGKGIVLATAHSGNWELLGGGLALNGYQIVGVAQKQTNGSMDKFINEYRRVIGMDIAYKNSVRELRDKFLENFRELIEIAKPLL